MNIVTLLAGNLLQGKTGTLNISTGDPDLPKHETENSRKAWIPSI